MARLLYSLLVRRQIDLQHYMVYRCFVDSRTVVDDIAKNKKLSTPYDMQLLWRDWRLHVIKVIDRVQRSFSVYQPTVYNSPCVTIACRPEAKTYFWTVIRAVRIELFLLEYCVELVPGYSSETGSSY